MNPSGLTTTPDPRLLSTRPPEPKMSSSPKKNASNGDGCRRTNCWDEMLATAGTVRSATRVKSGSVAAADTGPGVVTLVWRPPALLLVLDRRRTGRTIAGVRKHAAGGEAERQDDGEREQAPHGHLL